MRVIGLSVLVSLFGLANALAQTTVPKAAQPESAGQTGAAVGATLFELGQTQAGDVTYVAHGYAAAEIKEPSAAEPAASGGELSFRLKELCVKEAQAQVFPLGLIEAETASGADAASPFFITGVKVDVAEQQKETCTYTVKINFGVKLPPKSKLTQVGYAVFLRGAMRTPESKPAILPKGPF